MLDILKTILLGIVEGITEWLPISSTGHMILIDEFVSLNVSEEFKELFLVVIQLGAILAVVLLFWKKIWPFHTKSAEIKPYFKENTAVKRLCYNYVHIDKIILWIKILIASVPAAILGVLFDDEIDAMLTEDGRAYVVSATLIIYGILFIIIESISKKEKHTDLDKLPYTTAFFIGLIQCLALIPGTSRSGSTILGAMLLGATRTVSTEFSFFLSIPAMFGASAIKILKYFLDGNSFNSDELIILVVGMIVAFVVSVLAIKFLVSYIKKHNFKAFGYYRIVLGIIVLAYFLFV